MKALSFFILSLLSTQFYSQITNVWQFGIGGSGEERTLAVETDMNGNIYTCGHMFSENMDFDPGSTTYLLSNQAGWDIYVAKFESDGDLIWARVLPGAGYNDAYDLDVDFDGGVIVTGIFNGSVNFDPINDLVLEAEGTADAYVVRINSDGSTDYAFNIGGEEGTWGRAVVADVNTTILTGVLQDSVDFDPGPGEYKLAPVNNGVFVAKYQGSSLSWAKIIEGNIGIDVEDITLDDSGNIFVVGDFSGLIDMDPSVYTDNYTSNGLDGYLIKLDPNGEFVFGRQFTGDNDDLINAVAIGNDGRILIAGLFQSNIYHDPQSTIDFTESTGGYDPFVVSLNTDGSYHWSDSFSGNGDARFTDVIIEENYDIYLTGYFNGTLTPYTGISQFAVSGNDIFCIKLSQDGAFINSLVFGGDGHDIISNHSSSLHGGSIILGGDYLGTIDFGPGEEILSGPITNGNEDLFLAKFNIGELVQVEEKIPYDNILIYPNPAINQIRFDLKNTPTVYEIVDLEGSLISRGMLNAQEDIDISNLKVGEYFLKINNQVQRFIKLN